MTVTMSNIDQFFENSFTVLTLPSDWAVSF